MLRQVYAKIRKHRESLNLSTVALEERQVYRDDFLLVVFDYYLAMGLAAGGPCEAPLP